MICTIETDPASPFGPPEVPAAEWTYRAVLEQSFARGPQFVLAWLGKAGVNRPPAFPRGMSLEHSVDAYVNHGRWLWDCPRCNAAQVASDTDLRAFCTDCFNGGDGYYAVRYPAARAAIETLLDRRPETARHWTPGETVEQLQAENIAHGFDGELDGYEWPGAKDATAIAKAWLDERAQLERERRLELEAGQ